MNHGTNCFGLTTLGKDMADHVLGNMYNHEFDIEPLKHCVYLTITGFEIYGQESSRFCKNGLRRWPHSEQIQMAIAISQRLSFICRR